MGAAKWVGQIIRREQPARVTDATPASIHVGPRRQALRRPVVSQIARRGYQTAHRSKSRTGDSRCVGAGIFYKGKPQPNVRIRPGLPRSRSKSDGSDVASLIDCALANPYSEPAGPLAGRLALGPHSGRRAERLPRGGVYFVYDRPDSQPGPASCPLRSTARDDRHDRRGKPRPHIGQRPGLRRETCRGCERLRTFASSELENGERPGG
jgi:hypothetical protein